MIVVCGPGVRAGILKCLLLVERNWDLGVGVGVECAAAAGGGGLRGSECRDRDGQLWVSSGEEKVVSVSVNQGVRGLWVEVVMVLGDCLTSKNVKTR